MGSVGSVRAAEGDSSKRMASSDWLEDSAADKGGSPFARDEVTRSAQVGATSAGLPTIRTAAVEEVT